MASARYSHLVGRLAGIVLALPAVWTLAAAGVFAAASPEPPDRLAEPVLPESPSQVDMGRNLYYFHCMPCHGDRGQGLTDEWRALWVEDHQNCWGRGCHTGKSEVDAFYLPRTVPSVSGSAGMLDRFETAEDLFTYLRETQPPQRPGALSETQYWALTAFLLHENGRLATRVERGTQMLGNTVPGPVVGLGLLALSLALVSGAAVGRRGKVTVLEMV